MQGSQPSSQVEPNQTALYDKRYDGAHTLRQLLRFDVRYRCRRMHEVLAELGIDPEDCDVLDVGFAAGAMLASFPRSCRIVGADVSRSAAEQARREPSLQGYAEATFVQVPEDDPDSLPPGPFDLIVCSHTLEHVPNDALALAALSRRLRPGGHLLLFVPIEEPDYIPFHLRNYSLQTIQQVVRDAALEIRFVEGSMHINGHVWKIITIPSRRRWPVVRHLVDALRGSTLSLIPYPLVRRFDASLHRLGVGPRQAFVVARRPAAGERPGADPAVSRTRAGGAR